MSVDTHDSPHAICWSPRPTLGIEQELHTVRRSDYQLVAGAPLLLGCLRRLRGVAAHVDSEYMANTIELTTPVSRSVGDALRSLRRLHTTAAREASAHSLALSPIGLHPFADPAGQTVTDTPRYQQALHREQIVGVEQQIISVHIHVGVPSGDAAMAAMDELATLTPLFIALAASSPFHRGVDTGYESFRPMLGDRLPPSGVPPHFDTWADFTSWFDSMKAATYINNLTDIWWDIRPSRYGTIELRICDGVASYPEIAALAALAQCAVASVSERNAVRRHLSHDQLRLNRFEAQRFGVDATVSLSPGEARRPLRDHLEATIARLIPTARRLGCEAELLSLRTFVAVGSSARRQRRTLAATGSMSSVVAAAVGELGGATISPSGADIEGLSA